jgi:hypothetical protein
MKRIFDGVLIAVLASGVIWAAGHRAAARDVGVQGWNVASGWLAQFEVAAWWATATATVLAVMAVAVRIARGSEPGFWELDLHLPSPAFVLASVSMATAAAALGLRLAAHGSIWGLALIGVATYGAIRGMTRLRWSVQQLLRPSGL